MADLGNIALLLAIPVSLYSIIGSFIGKGLNSLELVRSARYAALSLPLVLGIATGCLVLSFVTHDFEIKYVAEHSNFAMEPWLTWVAFYAGNEGSLLFIANIYSLLAFFALWRVPVESQFSLPYTTAVMMLVVLFFTLVMATMANPFELLPFPPQDGQGINPLLTHPGMIIHPPMLMTGLVGVAIPFSFAMGHLLSGETGDQWIDAARTWGLIIWAILAIGLLLGAWWAYTILGWGGYWAWDPVENAGLLPWLPLTAFIHSIMVQRRRGMFRMWNIVLIILAWGGAMYGMFMNRGGPVPSVHSFGQSSLGWVFLAFLAGMLIFAFILFFLRYPRLKSRGLLESAISRESAFLLNNLLFLFIALAVLWGMVYPLVSQMIRDITVTVGRPFYDLTAGPLFLALVFLMGVGPLLPWRQTSRLAVRRNLTIPMVCSLIVALIALLIGVRSLIPLLSFTICSLAAASVWTEWIKGTLVRRRRHKNILFAFIRLILSNRPRYGGYIAHLGVVLIAFAVIGSSFYGFQKDIVLFPGESTSLGGYTLEYVSSDSEVFSDRTEHRAKILVLDDNKIITTLHPGYAFYPDFSMAATRAGIHSNFIHDIYIIANEFSDDGSAVFRLYLNPLMIWMWLAGPLFILGTLIALWPGKRPSSVL